jgi:uncharacterized phage protein (TIGR02218 family)
MKIVSEEYQTREEANTKQPQELYHFWWGESHWTYTSGDSTLTYNARDYEPSPISRGSVVYNSNLEVSQLAITAHNALQPLIKFLAQNPVELIWVEVLRVFRDQSPIEVGVVFIGQVKMVSVKGLAASVTCVGFESYLKQPIPTDRYGPQCNATLFDSRCGMSDLNASFFAVLTDVLVLENGTCIKHADLAGFDSHFFSLGFLVWGNHKRMITDHQDEKVYIRFAIPDLISGETVTVYAGCDGNLLTCKDKFNNMNNHRGMPFIPMDNPVLWS